jgi:hypothetical protein
MNKQQRNTHIEGQWQNNTENGIVLTECDVHEAFADALTKNHFALNYCPKCGEKL